MEKPDLIVLPECCDRPRYMLPQQIREYYAERGSHYIRSVAKENNCYIAYAAVRDEKGGTRRNGCISIPYEYHKLQFIDLINAIENNQKPFVNEYEGRKPADIILAAYESSRTGKKVELK